MHRNLDIFLLVPWKTYPEHFYTSQQNKHREKAVLVHLQTTEQKN